MSDLAEFLREQKKKADQEKVDWDKTKADWLNALRELFQLIKGWLADPQKQGFVKLQDTEEVLEEEHLGTYEAPGLNVVFGTVLVRFIPKGRLIIGARGRVDIETFKGKFMLVLQGDGGWQLVRERLNKDQQIPFNEESFTAFVKELLA